MGKRLLISIIFFISCTSVFSQGVDQDPYWCTHYNGENGLSQNSVLSIGQDENRFLWLATSQGLVRFDGTQFVTYSTSNSSVIQNDRIMGIAKWKHNILVGMDLGGGVFFINRRSHPKQILHDRFKDQIISYNSDLHVRARFRKLFSYNVSLLARFDSLTSHTPFIEGKLYDAGNDNYYITLSCDTFYMENGRMKLLLPQNILRNNTLHFGTRLYVFDKNMLLTNAYDKGVGIDTHTNWNIDGHTLQPSLLQNIKNHVTGNYMIYADHLYRVRLTKDTFASELIASNVPYKWIKCVYTDSATGSSIIGTAEAGLFFYKKKLFRAVLSAIEETTERRPLPINVLYSQVPLDNNTIVSTRVIFKPDGTSTINPQDDYLTSFLKDEQGRIWHSAYHFVYICNQDLKVLDKIRIPDMHAATGFYRDVAKDVTWITTNENVFYFQHQQPYHLYGRDGKDIPGALCIAPYTRDTLLIGTNTGIVYFDQQAGKTGYLPNLPHAIVRYIKPEQSGGVWICTYGKGIYHYNNGKLVKLPLDANNRMLTTHYLLEDKNGFFWMPTNNGLFQAKHQDMVDYVLGKRDNIYYYYYYRKDGFGTNEFNGGFYNCGIRRPDGLFSLSSLNGLVWFRPEEVRPTLPESPILIEKITVDTTLLKVKGPLNIRPSFKQLNFDIVSAYFGTQENQQIQYRLIGNDTNWHMLRSDNKITFNNLPYGNYTLQLRKYAGLNDHYVTVSSTFTVQRFWYQTRLFFTLAILIFIVLAWITIRIRVHYLLQNARHLEQEVTDRTTSLHKTMDSLRDTIDELNVVQEALHEGNMVKERAISIILHDLRSPTKFLAATSERIFEHFEDLTPEEHKEFIANIYNSSAEIGHLTDDLLQWLLSQKSGFQPKLEIVNIATIYEEVQSLYGELVKLNKNTLLVGKIQCAQVIADMSMLYFIVRNLVDNANKNCRNGIISLSVQKDPVGDQTRIVVEDTGYGMTAEQLNKLEEVAQSGVATAKETGMGYQFIFLFLKLLEAPIEIKSELGVGTRVEILLVCADKNP